MRILCLGNEFIEEDSLAKRIGAELASEFEIIFINDSFQLMEFIKNNDDFFILDVVSGLDKVRLLNIEDLDNIKIMNAHDFDAGFVLKLFSNQKNIKIIGIPETGDIFLLKDAVLNMLSKSKV